MFYLCCSYSTHTVTLIFLLNLKYATIFTPTVTFTLTFIATLIIILNDS